jgi:hypothetical protein
MHLDDDKINAWEDHLRAQRETLLCELETLHLTAAEAEQRRQALQDVHAKQATLARLVSRNILSLTRVTRKVFVSTKFEDGRLPAWLSGVFERVQFHHAQRQRGRLEFLVGSASVGRNFRQAILERLLECHYFLSVVTEEAEPAADGLVWPVRPYLMEEIGAAFPLPKLTLIAVERGLDPAQVGKLFGSSWQRLIFDRGSAEGRERFAVELSDALHNAPEAQAEIIARKKQTLALFD